MNDVGAPKVSIIMATYNRAHLIEETLDSLLNQSYKNWECLIIDDGSTDNTKEILQKYLQKDPRFNYNERTKDHKKGLPGCRNQGVDQAQGKYIQFFDDDDIIHPENLKTNVQILKESEYDFCRYDKEPFTGKYLASQFEKIGQFKKTEFSKNALEDMLTGKIPFASCTVLWDKRCFEKIRFNEDLMYAEEWECYSRILSQGFTGVSINLVLYYNRKHPESNTGEFWNRDINRINSYETAAVLIIENLGRNSLLNKNLKRYFLRLGFMLKSQKIITNILRATSSGNLEKAKYLIGYKIYPILKPIFYIKAKILKF